MSAMPRLLEIALILDLVGLLATLPCLLKTTPITMTLFFVAGIPLFAAGFATYGYMVIGDLRRHQVL